MKILKFGGTSVGSPEAIKQTLNIIIDSKKETEIAVVVSAFSGVTDLLIETANQAKNGDKNYLKNLTAIEDRHLESIRKLVNLPLQKVTKESVLQTLEELKTLLHGVNLIRELSYRSLDLACSFGERLSAYIISQSLNSLKVKTAYLDARKLVKTNAQFNNARVDFAATNKNIQEYFQKNSELQIITGFIGSTEENETTTLGRGGSDYTAAIFGAALDTKVIEIWTDVDGIMTADPRKVEKAFSIRHLSYEEAMEMSHFGAKVIHPPTMQPALKKGVPIAIRNTFNPEFSGSMISSSPLEDDSPIRGVSSINAISLIKVQGSGLIGVAGISKRLFGALAQKNINIILISQASSEHSICLAISPKDEMLAQEALQEEFENEIKSGLIDPPHLEKNLAIIAVVGKNMQKNPGIAGKVFQALGNNGINIIAIAQGSSELNISLVIAQKDESKAIKAIHDSLFLSHVKSLNLFLIGPGQIGKTLLHQISQQQDFLKKNHQLEIKVCAIANSKSFLLEENGIDLQNWETALQGCKEKVETKKFLSKIFELNLPNTVVVDCTSSEEIAAFYSDILNHSISIVTPNKKANSGDLKQYLQTLQAATKTNAKFLYETNVGAGLPIISTLHDLLLSGDQILKIEAVLSGTLSYIFNSFNSTKSFSNIVKEAQEKGYTEPDPRDDLNGVDVGRKILILARECGKLLDLSEVEIESLIPENCEKAKSVEEFFKQLKISDADFKKKILAAEKKGNRLRYIASFENSKAKVSLQEVDSSHPFYGLSGSDNMISFTTKRYYDRPLVIRGPGAGAEVTAAGVFADIIKIASVSFNKQLNKYSFAEKLKANKLNLSLIGMSNIGKTSWSKKLADLNFQTINCDDLIENKLKKQLERAGLKSLTGVAKWLGHPYEKTFTQREHQYIKHESIIMDEILEKNQRVNKNTVIDTTGSVIYCHENVISKLKKNSLVVYIQATKQMEDDMYENFLKNPKPIVWQSIYKSRKGETMEQTLKRCYKELLDYRRKLYENLADITIPYTELNLEKLTAPDFLSLIQERL